MNILGEKQERSVKKHWMGEEEDVTAEETKVKDDSGRILKEKRLLKQDKWNTVRN